MDINIIYLVFAITLKPVHSLLREKRIDVEIDKLSYQSFNSPRNVSVKHKRSLHDRRKACEMLISFDEPFWEYKEKNMTELIDIATKHVEKLNQVFTKLVFVGEYNEIYFRLARVQVSVLY